MNKDLEHLRLLSVFHYVVGGLTALIGCFPLIHLSIGIAMLSGAIPVDNPARPGESPFPVQMFGLMFTIIPLIIIAIFWTLAICMIVAGRRLSSHRSYTFCLVVAGLMCMMAPLGTVLGVFTIIVLMRDSVKSLFTGASPGETAAPFGNTPPNWQ